MENGHEELEYRREGTGYKGEGGRGWQGRVSQGKGHVEPGKTLTAHRGLYGPLVGTDGVLKGQGLKGTLGRHMDSLRNRGGKRRGGKLLGKEREKDRGQW